MFTAVYTPGLVITVVNVYLGTVTFNVVQPNLSSAETVDVFRLRSDVSDSITRSNNRPDANINAFSRQNSQKFLFYSCTIHHHRHHLLTEHSRATSVQQCSISRQNRSKLNVLKDRKAK